MKVYRYLGLLYFHQTISNRLSNFPKVNLQTILVVPRAAWSLVQCWSIRLIEARISSADDDDVGSLPSVIRPKIPAPAVPATYKA